MNDPQKKGVSEIERVVPSNDNGDSTLASVPLSKMRQKTDPNALIAYSDFLVANSFEDRKAAAQRFGIPIGTAQHRILKLIKLGQIPNIKCEEKHAPKGYFTVKAAMSLIGIKETTLRAALRRGAIRGAGSDGDVYFAEAEVLRFKTSRSNFRLRLRGSPTTKKPSPTPSAEPTPKAVKPLKCLCNVDVGPCRLHRPDYKAKPKSFTSPDRRAAIDADRKRLLAEAVAKGLVKRLPSSYEKPNGEALDILPGDLPEDLTC